MVQTPPTNPKEFFERLPTLVDVISTLPAIEPGKAILDRLLPPVDRVVKQSLIEAGCFLHSALIANNPDLFRTVVVHAVKKLALERLDAEDRDWCDSGSDLSCALPDGTHAIRVNAYEVMRMMRRVAPEGSFDIKTVQRHLDAEVATGDLRREPDGKYLYRSSWATLAPVMKPPWQPRGD